MDYASTLLDPTRVFGVAQEIVNEVVRQDAKWGEQNHDDGTGPATLPLRGLVAPDHRGYLPSAVRLQQLAKQANDEAVAAKRPTWAGILVEELFEALAEPASEPELREELIQVAAVALNWIVCLDRNLA